jgi:hypothetical protein
MSASGRTGLSAEFFDLVDAYCSDLIDDVEVRRLETFLQGSAAARRYFTDYFHHHTEIHFSVRAHRAAGAVLEQLGPLGDSPKTQQETVPTRVRRSAAGWRLGMSAAAAVAIAATVVAWFAIGRPGGWGWPRLAPAAGGKTAVANIAWLVNAQDCLWAQTGERPGRDMRAGKELRLERGLAEIEFDCGARVILQGPAGLELLSGCAARLLQGTLTARVPPHAKGFTVLTPHNKIVDLGTEFGLSVDEGGATTVRVFTGEVAAFPLAPSRADPGVKIRQDQTARIDGRIVAPRFAAPHADSVKYVRVIEPPPVLTPRTLRLDFTSPVPGTLQDQHGQGIGLTHRLPGTGGDLPECDPNLLLHTDRGALELTTTRSDINTQDRMETGEYLGVRLSDLGFTGKEDFEIRATIPRIPGLKVVGQFGLYAGSQSSRNIRGGLISWPKPDTFGLFLVNNVNGRDADLYEVGLMTTGDDLQLTLRRLGGQYSLVVDDLTRHNSSTLAIAHPRFLDQESDLYVGLFGANTQSNLRKTLTIRELSVTVWTAGAGAGTSLKTEN